MSFKIDNRYNGIGARSADNFKSLLEEDDIDVIKTCLDEIIEILPENWNELYDSIKRIELFANCIDFNYKELASSIVSRLYFYAGEYDMALEYAIKSGHYYNPYGNTEYSKGMTYKFIDKYIQIKREIYENKPINMVDKLQDVVLLVVNDNIKKNNYNEVIGLAIEMRGVEILERAIIHSNLDPTLLAYCVDCVNCYCDDLNFRKEVLNKILNIYTSSCNNNDHSLLHIAKYLFLLDDKEKLSGLLKRLISPESTFEDDLPVALQICFDLFDNCPQYYLMSIIEDLQVEASMQTALLISKGIIEVPACDGDEILTSSGINYKNLPYLKNLNIMVSILEGTVGNKLEMEFMIKYLKYDNNTLQNMQENARYSIAHTATSICNALIHLGTACDTLMRNNIEWVGRSVGWGRFMMVSSLGLIHKGHGEVIIKILEPYLPGNNKTNGSLYQESGALYAIGLAYAKCGNSAIKYFIPHLKEDKSNIILHGACLGVGLAGLGSWRSDICKTLLKILHKEDAISGEASSIACGLIMLGSEDKALYEEFKEILFNSTHEKIQRGISLSIGMLFALKRDAIKPYYEELLHSTIPIIRHTAVYMIAMAYAGTSDINMVKILWIVAVSDTNDDIKRACIISMAIVMFRDRNQFLGIALLFVSSFNPYLKSGALLGIGILFAGSGMENLITIMRSYFNDRFHIVRQAAYIACSMLLIQRNEQNCQIYRETVTSISNQCTERHTDTIAKLGAYIGFGILDCGGRNQTLSFTTVDGNINLTSIVGFLIFQQFWYWYPLVHFIGLCFIPSSIILVNCDLKTPQDIKFTCSSDLSLYTYPTFPTSVPKKENEKVRLTQLSHSKSSRSKQRRSINFKDSDGNPVLRIKKSRLISMRDVSKFDESQISALRISLSKKSDANNKDKQLNLPLNTNTQSSTVSEQNKEQSTVTTTNTTNDKNNDPVSNLTNPCRSLHRQLPFMSISDESMPLQTVKPITSGGIILCFKSNTNQNTLQSQTDNQTNKDN